MLDHRHESKMFSLAPDPLSLKKMPAPSGLRLGMHPSILIAASIRGQRIAANGALWALNVVQRGVNRERRVPKRCAWDDLRRDLTRMPSCCIKESKGELYGRKREDELD